MTKRSVVGLDLSLRQTAMVYLPEEWARSHDWSLVRYRTVGAKLHHHSTPVEVVEHIADVATQVFSFVEEHEPTSVFLEEYAFSRNGAYAHTIGELGGVVKHHLVKRFGYDIETVVASSARKLAFGKVPRGVDVKVFIEKRLSLAGAPFAPKKEGEGERDAWCVANYGLTEIGLPAMTIPAPEEVVSIKPVLRKTKV